MVAITSPVRLTPTPEYYKSYYYQVDAYSQASNYAYKTLREKLNSPATDPYDPDHDPSLPLSLPKKEAVDIVKSTMKALQAIKGTTSKVFETAQATLHIRLVEEFSEQEISINTVLMSVKDVSDRLAKSIEGSHFDRTSIILPKGFKEAGVKIGDSGYIAYHGFGAITPQENHLQVHVAGFYDPGILPLGAKIALVPPEILAQVESSSLSENRNLPTGISVDFPDIKNAEKIKHTILEALEKAHLAKYWDVESYNDYEFTKDIFQQMRSDKNLFSLISIIIMVVASSNIISMLIILVHDKRKEVAILRALGASKASIGLIFGLCGFLLGAVGSIIGTIFAILTLNNISAILAFFGKLQGFEVLSSAYYANTLPSQVHVTSLLFVVAMAAVASCLAGLIPAIQASRINTSEALRNE